MAPEFADLLLGVPEEKREGKVFVLRFDTIPLARDRARVLCKSIAEKAGVGHAKFHDYRRAFGTRMAMEEDATVFELMKLMRHRDIKTTLKFYVHLDAQTITGNLRRRKREKSGNKCGDIPAENTGFLGVS